MTIGHPEPADRIAFEVELDQHHGFLADDPAVMSRLYRHDLGRLVLHDTPVGIFDVNFAARQKSDVGVHTEVGPDNRLHVDRPSESGGVHHALDAPRSSASNVEPHPSDLPAFSASHCGNERIRALRLPPDGSARFRGGGFSDALSRGSLFCHVTSPYLA